MSTRWQWGIFDCFKVVCAWLYALFSQSEAKVRNFLTSKNALLQVCFNVMLHESSEHLIECGQVFLMSGWEHQQVNNVHNDIGDAVDDSFHVALEAGGAPQQAHWAGDPLELAHARDCECSVWPGPQVQDHLPEDCSEFDGAEDA